MNPHNNSRRWVPIVSSPFSAQKNRGVKKSEVICLRWQEKKGAEFMFPSGDTLAKGGDAGSEGWNVVKGIAGIVLMAPTLLSPTRSRLKEAGFGSSLICQKC